MTADNLLEMLHVAKQVARENMNPKCSPAHLLKALLNRQFPFMKALDAAGIDVFYLEDWADIRMGEYAKTAKPTTEPELDDHADSVLSESESIAQKAGKDQDFIHVLIALVTPGVGFSNDQLKSLPVSVHELETAFATGAKSGNQKPLAVSSVTSRGSSNINKYCIDKLRKLQGVEFVPVIGRDREIKTITEVLNRRQKPHIVITGESGVGKSTLVEGFFHKIANKSAIDIFHEATLFEIDVSSLFAGASYKGEVEDRLQKLFNEIREFNRPIVFVDDIHELLDTSQGSGITSLIKSELSKGDITFIGATTTDKFRKSLGKDDALTRRFEVLEIAEPDANLAHKMIKNVIDHYQTHHDYTIDDEGLSESIRLSKRYLKEKSLPDSALDLIDRTMSSLKVARELIKKELPALRTEFEEIEKAQNEEKEALYADLFSRIFHSAGYLFSEENNSEDDRNSQIKNLFELLEALETQEKIVLPSHLSVIVSGITGIPAGKVKSDERERLMEIENTLKKRVIGQDHAVKVVSDAILESRSGLTKPGQPIGSFFFLGPTGTGKTELAKSLADFLFGDESAIIRFDMSEFKEEHSAALLYGAPPGYVGYEEGGLLVNKIRQKPYSIVLFDEIEKAHKSVFDVFLQILDEGKLHDRLGKEGDFSNSVILFTSNIGSDYIVKQFDQEIIPESNDLIKLMSPYFRPEFLGRVTEIIPFAPISSTNVARIFDIHLKKELLQLLEKLEITLEIDAADKEAIALKGFSPEYGARPIKGIIRNQLKRPLSRMIIANEIQKGDHLKVKLDENGTIKFEKAHERSVL
ncbi:ATP-dependent Clp protease ATP-binding subunit [Flavobacterium sp.]|uniref:AAA family ATPase n=1 Tax=Flavobacterium sp. TaxID=239 RepID=UPI0011FE03E8|nr:ATP-dependent Clp protease ATP-binding subunit [Flavobacterium sp.]RZJ70710.1 MAG: ATP-dependent Clp protease ATP-binding subunit [Flavobacterium sp.]